MGDPYALPVKQPKAPKNSKKNLARQAPEDPGDPLRTPPKDEGRNAAADDLEQEWGSRRSGVKINYSNTAEDGAARNAEADVDIRNTTTNGRGRDVVGVPPRGRGAAPKRPPREAERANAAYKLDSVRPSITGSDARSAGVVTGTYTLEGRWKAAAASREAALEQTRAADRDRNGNYPENGTRPARTKAEASETNGAQRGQRAPPQKEKLQPPPRISPANIELGDLPPAFPATLHLLPASKATVASAVYPDEVRLAEGVGISDGDFVEVADCFVAVARCEPGLKPSNPLKVYLSEEIARNLAHAAGTLMSQVSETESGAGVQDSCEIADGSESNKAARERETLLTALRKIGDSYEQDNCGADEKVQQVANERPQIATNCKNNKQAKAASSRVARAPLPEVPLRRITVPRTGQEQHPRSAIRVESVQMLRVDMLEADIGDNYDTERVAELGRWLAHLLAGGIFGPDERRFVSLFGRRMPIWISRKTPACTGGHEQVQDHEHDAGRSDVKNAPDDLPRIYQQLNRLEPRLALDVVKIRKTAVNTGAATSSTASASSEKVDGAGITPPVLSSGNSSSRTGGFSHVGGLHAIVEQLKTLVQNPLQNPEKYARFGVSAPKGLLLYGPPGTGKTLLAKALSEELQCHCEMLEAADVCAHPEPEAKIVEVFEKCREVALGLPPVDAEAKSLGKTSSSRKKGCLLFIDEIDALCPKREEALSESDRRVVATFLTLLDGVGAKDSWGDATSSGAGGGSPRSTEGRGGGLVLLAATNRPNALDPALRRPGRLDREIEVGAPNKQGRLQILEIMLLRMSMRSRISDEELLKVAEDTNGFVGADLQGLCNQVAMLLMDDDKNASCSSIASSFKAALQTVRPSALKELQIEIPSVYWRDIGGYSHLKEQLQQSVEWPFKYAELFAQMKLRAPKGILLYGPPGCSKTMMAKAVATESKMNFIGIKGPELFNKYVGESERRLRDVFRKARQAQPCVIFFDEIDSMAGDRGGGSGGGGGDSVSGRVLSQLLNEMDGVGKQQELVILAATNRPEALDPAILRPGRFDRLLYVRLPDLEARKEIFRRSLGKGTLLAEVESGVINDSPDDAQHGEHAADELEGIGGSDTEDVDGAPALLPHQKKKQVQRQSAQNYIDETILELAERTEQFSGAEVVNLVKEASLTAVREAIFKGLPKPGLTRKMLLGAVDKAKPRTSRAAIDFYENFEHKMA